MAGMMLVLGFLFWTGAAFAGARSRFLQSTPPPPAWPLRSKLGGSAAVGVGAVLVLVEAGRVGQHSGLVGALFALGVLSGVAGAVSLAAALADER